MTVNGFGTEGQLEYRDADRVDDGVDDRWWQADVGAFADGGDAQAGVGWQEDRLERRQVSRGGDLVLVQVGVHDLTILDLERLHERVAEPLSHCAIDLRLKEHRVQDA